MKKGETSATINSAGKGKAVVEDKGNGASYHTRIRMDFAPKISKLRDEEVVDRYLTSFGLHLNPGIKIEICPHLTFPQPRLKRRVCIRIPTFWYWG